MIRFEHLSGSLVGRAFDSPKAIVKIGRDPKSDIAYDPFRDSLVSTHHAEVRYGGSGYELYDLNSSNGTFVNDKKVTGSRKLRDGDVIMFGAGGPTMRFLVMPDNARALPAQRAAPAPQHMGPVPKTSRGQAHVSAAPQMQPPMMQQPQYGGTGVPQTTGPHKSRAMENLAAEAQAKIAAARAAHGGGPSGQTMFLMVETLEKGVKKSRKKYLWLVAILFVVAGGFGYVAYERGKELTLLKSKKTGLADQIKRLQMQMEMGVANEEQVAQLQALLGQAKATDSQLEKRGVKATSASGDFVTDELQKILAKFDQDNYAIPPLFRDTVKKHIESTIKRSNFKLVYGRKQRYWDLVRKEFGKRGIPEEMGYVAWTESQFDPSAESQVGAKGMWQFMPATARRYGLRVDDRVDERLDPSKLTPVAAQYLGDLLAEFGDLMLAIASYNKGESGMRTVLKKYGFWRKEQRNFWHLYYLKLLPEETLEYVPQILAAAIICSNPEKYGLPP